MKFRIEQNTNRLKIFSLEHRQFEANAYFNEKSKLFLPLHAFFSNRVFLLAPTLKTKLFAER